jgi:hypothetical protein
MPVPFPLSEGARVIERELEMTVLRMLPVARRIVYLGGKGESLRSKWRSASGRGRGRGELAQVSMQSLSPLIQAR